MTAMATCFSIELVAGADGPGRVIGIEITAASKTLAPGALDGLPAVA